MRKAQLRYDGNEDETYTLIMSDIPYAELLVGEDAAMHITETVKVFIDNSDGIIVDIKNDDDKLGLIVDMWDKDQDEVIDTLTIWFDDYSEW